jgi:hypothetical protein
VISTSLDAELSQLEVLIYPNLFQQEIKIKSNGLHSEMSIQIYDQGGRLVQRHMLNYQKESVDLSMLTSGIYFARILKDGLRVYSSKLIKK